MKKKATNRPNQHKNTPTGGTGNNRRTGRGKDVAATARPLSKHWLWPLVLVLAVLPLITLLHIYDPGMTDYPWFSAETSICDFFLYYKGFFLCLIAVVILLILAWLLPHSDRGFLKDKRSLPPLIAVALFGVMALTSALLAEHRDVAFFGGYEQFEGCLVLLSYLVCFFLAFGYARTIETIRFLLDAVLIGATVMGLLATFQSFGLDWTQTDLARSLIALPVGGRSGLNAMDIQLSSTQGAAFATLYNPNYVGSYVSLTLPYSLYLIVRGEKLWRRILAAVCTLLLIRTLLAADSAAGQTGIVAGAVIALVLIFPFLKKTWKFIVVGIGVIGIAALSYVMVSRGFFDALLKSNEEIAVDHIEDMVTEGDHVNIITKDGKTMVVKPDPTMLSDQYWGRNFDIKDTLSVTDSSGQALKLTYDTQGHATVLEKGYPALTFCYDIGMLDAERTIDHVAYEFSQLHIKDLKCEWLLTALDGKLMYFNSTAGRVDDMKVIPKTGFEGHYGFASGRGYIWARTLPLLTDHMLTGAGPDHFTYEFPQDDYVGKQYWGYNGLLTTRPHNMYLQIWVQEGFIAMLAFIVLFGVFFIRALRICFGKKRVKTAEKGINFRDVTIVSAVATAAYMVAGLANDAIVCVAPVFWVVLGIGYAAEARCRKEFQQ